ncbi:HHLA2 protein, partial [Alectura lathami]|nr:HHLA2 protein [Alectura lathami]
QQETVTGLFSKSVILPCPFPPGNNEVIYWTKEEKDVHSYYYQQDQLKSQHLDYKNRTLLFHESIPHGNASLKLSNVTLTDEGRYHCYVGTQQSRTEVEVMLHVRVSSYYTLEYEKTDTERMLRCYAFCTYPAPHITWEQGNASIQETGQDETRVGVLYTFRSDQNIRNPSDPYSCHIHLPHEDWTAEWRMRDQLSKARGSSIAIPCEYSSNPSHSEEFSVVWKLYRNAAVSVLASSNGTFHFYQPRVQINQSDLSLMLKDLDVSDSGEYLCNISARHYTKLTVTTLQV